MAWAWLTGSTIIQIEQASVMMTNSMSTKRSDNGARWREASGNATRVSGFFWEEWLVRTQRDDVSLSASVNLTQERFLQWSETTSTFRKAWVSFLVTWFTVKVWKYSWSGTDVWGQSSLWSRDLRLWKFFFLSDFPVGGSGSFWQPC